MMNRVGRYFVLALISVTLLFYILNKDTLSDRRLISLQRKTLDHGIERIFSEGAREEKTLHHGLESLCSERATNRGPHQKVVSYIFFGGLSTKRQYFQGIEKNTELVKKFYPGWTVRIYHNITDDSDVVMKSMNKIQTRFENLDICDVTYIKKFLNISDVAKKLWRFIPIADPTVDLFLSRDLDSRISEREVAAVSEWLNTTLTIHVMRDHPDHLAAILGGTWGAQVFRDRELLSSLMMKMIEMGSVPEIYEVDQDLLLEVVWPAVEGNLLQHDSYNCKKFSSHGNMRAWPTRRIHAKWNFVGSVIVNHGVDFQRICPMECRPPNHLDWKTC